jgi:hypothetical protein
MPGYGQQPYGAGGYGGPGYGPQPYAPPGFPAPAWRPPDPPQPRRGRTLVVSLIAGGVAVLAAVGVVLWLTLGRGTGPVAADRTATTSPGSGDSAVAPSPGGQASDSSAGSGAGLGGATVAGIPPATVPPTGLGDDEVLNGYARDCFGGNMVSCDVMYVIADRGTTYSVYGDTCAGRQPEGTDQLCEEAFPG